MNETESIQKTGHPKLRLVFTIFVNLLTFLSGLFLIFCLYKISGVEDKIRYIAMFVILLINIILILVTRKLFKPKRKLQTSIAIILSILFIGIQLFGGYFLYRTYSSLNNMNKDKITYTAAIVVKNNSKLSGIEDLKNKNIGIVIDETSIDGYIIGTEIIKEHDLNTNSKIKEYASVTSMVKDLYDKKIEAIIISKNYPSMFKSIDKYKNIEDETKIIFEKSKTLTKEEASKYTGDDILNFNTSDKIDKPFTLLVMGIDSTMKELSKNATGNGDALMLVTFNPKTLNATILSIPRDTYVPIACFAGQKENKITHAAWNGESCMIKTIENFTGINIDYYVKINFQGVIGLVNALGGIDVDVPIEFCESNSKRSTRSENLICLKKGQQKLNGEQALALARHRKTLLTGDLQRGVNQQIVVQGMLNKLKSIRSANQLLKILDTVSQSMDTNFTTKQILSFYDIAKKLIKTSNSSSLINMDRLYLSGSSAMIYDEGIGLTLYEYIPDKASLNAIVTAMKQNLGLESITIVKNMEFDIENPFELKTIGADVYGGGSSYTLLPSFIGSSESYARSWLSNHGIGVNVVYKETNSASEGQVIDQSIPENKRLDLISGSITLTVATATSKTVEPESTQEPEETTKPSEPDPKPTVCDKVDLGYIDDGNGNCICPKGTEDNGTNCVEQPHDPEPNPEENNGD